MSSSEWQEVKLVDICDVKGGKRLPKGSNLITDKTNHPYIRIKDMYQHKYIENNGELEFVDNETFKVISKYIVNSGDVIIAIVGNTIGLVALIGKSLDKASLTENCVKLINLKNCLAEFIYYYLITDTGQSEIKSKIVGTSQPKLPIYGVQDIRITLPKIEEQSNIVNILSSLDEKIEVNNQINEKLQSISHLLFKHWFVDFEFPNDEGLPYKSSGGEMVDSELGIIPKRWEIETIKDITFNFDSKRKPLSSRQREEMKGEYPYYGATSIIDYVDDYIFDGIYVLLGEDGTVINNDGTPVLQYVWKKAWVNNHAHVLQGNGISSELLYLYLKTQNINNIVTGAVQLKINQANLNSVKVILANQNVIEQFEELIQALFVKIRNLADENDNLTSLRDTLLPKLMNGEIDLNNIEINQ